jgi:hypothetical protein
MATELSSITKALYETDYVKWIDATAAAIAGKQRLQSIASVSVKLSKNRSAEALPRYSSC